MKIANNAVWAPDYILESSGIACGDKISLYAYKEGNNIFFTFICDSCSISKKIAQYLEDELSGKDEDEIFNFVKRLRQHKYSEVEKWMEIIPRNRQSCIDSPVGLLYNIFTQINYEQCDLDNNALACDACVQARSINWNVSNKVSKHTKTISEMWHEINNIDDTEERKMQLLGLAVLKKEEINEFNTLMSNMTSKKLKKVKKLRLASPYYNNSIKYGIKLDKDIDALISKQIISTIVADEEIQVIERFINDNKLHIDGVKGCKTNSYYPHNLCRTHMDYDYLAESLEDAFRLINYLINERGFKLIIGGSVPFSFKAVYCNIEKEILTGHIHLEKILQDTYQVVVDINMGGFPLGRTSVIKCNKNGKVDIEDLICITVAHLFKHEHAFIKDINDLYYLLENENVNDKKLIRKLYDNNLQNLFYVVYNFLKKHMELKRIYDIKGSYIMLKLSKKKWPYSRKQHFLIKAVDMLKLCCKQYGLCEGVSETQKQILGIEGNKKTTKYVKLCSVYNQRTYLYPVVFFKKYFNLSHISIDKIYIVDEVIGIYENIAVMPIGIFIIRKNIEEPVSRVEVENNVQFIIDKLNISQNDCNFSYIMEARKDTWLY